MYKHNDSIQPARAVDFTQVKTPDRGLGCNRLFVDCTTLNVFKYNQGIVVVFVSLGGNSVGQQIGIPGIVRNGVVVPQSSHPLPEGSHVEIRLEPGEIPSSLRSEIEAWDRASDESWKWIETFESDEK